MISAGRWRWPLLVALPVLAGSLLFWQGIGRLRYEGKTLLVFSGDSKQVDEDLVVFRSDDVRKKVNLALAHSAGPLIFEKVPGHPLEVSIKAQAERPGAAVQALAAAGKACVDQSFLRQKEDFHKVTDVFQKQYAEMEVRYAPLLLERQTLIPAPRGQMPRSDRAAKIRTLQARRQKLIEQYPTHTDIALLAAQIKDLQNQPRLRLSHVSARQQDLDRRINECKMWMDYLSRRLHDLAQAEQALQPAWTAARAIETPSRPIGMDQWPMFAGVVAGTFLLGFVFLKRDGESRQEAAPNGLWRPGSEAADPKPELPIEIPVELKVIPAEPELPSDPLTEKAASIYAKWIEVAKVLYAPAPEPPQGILESVGPLLQESSEFLPEGHDVMARYLAHTVAPGDLPAHVARTVLMTLTGAEEAGATPEHRLAMALAALFHDLAVVPRPAPVQDDVGSDVGRLSASVLRRIPGLQPAILSMVEEILIGMDEFKLETWQNAAAGKTLEPLSKVLREIDRFEKVMQKQRARLDRHITRKTA